MLSHELTSYLSIINQFKLNELWPYYQKHVNQILLNRTTIGLCSNFVDCESFLESNSPDTLALCQINPDDSIDSGNFLVIGYLPLIRNDSSTHMHGLAVNLKEGLPFARELSLENSADSYLCFRLALLDSVSYFFCSINHLLCLCAWLLILFHLT